MRRRKAFREVFDSIDIDGGGTLDLEEFTQAYRKLLFDDLTDRQIALVFRDTDVDGSGEVDFEEFVEAMDASSLERLVKLQMKNDDKQAWLLASEEIYYGKSLRETAPASLRGYNLVETQHVSMKLYESRIASLERCVAFFVMSHALGRTVADWWPFWTLGFFRYRIDRTHSIMRIATTASPVSGADIRERMKQLALVKQCRNTLQKIVECQSSFRLRLLLAGVGFRPPSRPESLEPSRSSTPPPFQNGPTPDAPFATPFEAYSAAKTDVTLSRAGSFDESHPDHHPEELVHVRDALPTELPPAPSSTRSRGEGFEPSSARPRGEGSLDSSLSRTRKTSRMSIAFYGEKNLSKAEQLKRASMMLEKQASKSQRS